MSVRLLGFWFSLTLFLSCGFSEESEIFPIPVSVDKKWVKTELWLECPSKNYDIKLSEVDSNNKLHVVVNEFFDAVKRGDSEKCYSLMKRDVVEGKEGAAKIVEMVNRSYGSLLGEFRIFKEIMVGDEIMVIVGSNVVPDRLKSFWKTTRLGMYFVKSEGEWVWNPTPTNPIAQQLLTLFQRISENPTDFETLQEIPLEGVDKHKLVDQQGGKVYFYARGEHFEFDMYADEDLNVENEFLVHYKKIHAALKNEPIEVFADYLTEMSKKKFMDQIQKTSAEEYKVWFDKEFSTPKIVYFILSSDGFNVVFYKRDRGQAGYEYDLLTDTSSGWKICNFSRRQNFDNLMASSELFQEIVVDRREN